MHTAIDSETHYLRRLGQLTTFRELLKKLFSLDAKSQAESRQVQPPNGIASQYRLIQIRHHIAGPHMVAIFVYGNFNAGVFQVSYFFYGFFERQIRKTSGGCGDYHAQTPSSGQRLQSNANQF
jgi:hypothetical protein